MFTFLTPFLEFDLDFEQHSFFQTNVAAVARRYETMSSTESGNDSGLPFLATVSAQSFFTWSYLESNLYLCVVFCYRVIFSPRLVFSPLCVVASSRKFQLAASQNYTLFAYNLIIRCLRYCEF